MESPQRPDPALVVAGPRRQWAGRKDARTHSGPGAGAEPRKNVPKTGAGEAHAGGLRLGKLVAAGGSEGE